MVDTEAEMDGDVISIRDLYDVFVVVVPVAFATAMLMDLLLITLLVRP